MGAFLSTTSLAILKHMKANGRSNIDDLRAANVCENYKDLHRLYEYGFVFAKGSKERKTTYDITSKGVKCLAQGGVTTGLNERVVISYVRPADATPSRTIWNSTSREPYRTGDGRGRYGLAMIGV